LLELLREVAERANAPLLLLCTARPELQMDRDLQAAKALIPWLNQAHGMPTERVEHRPPSTLEELEQMDTAELERLVARGRERRLQAVRAVPGPAGTEG
jgi:hypothetical protein